MKIKLTRYRVVRDRYAGYEVQKWRLWFPFWIQCGFVNTHLSLEAAQQYIELHKNNNVIWSE